MHFLRKIRLFDGYYDSVTPLNSATRVESRCVAVLSKAMAIDHGPQGIRVNCLCTGPVATQLLEDVFAGRDAPRAYAGRSRPPPCCAG
jgi:hypothetical protein